MEKTLHLVSLGCTKNLIDSEVMLGRLKEYSLTDDAQSADLIIVNTCGFIQSAKEESLNTIFELDDIRKESSVLVMSGCLSERYKEELQESLQDEVDIFTGVGDYDIIDQLVEEKRNQFSNKVFLATEKNIRVVTGSSYHAYIKLSEGCNQQCSFCAIPNFKGKLNSRTLDSIKEEVQSLVSQGFYDFSFVSQDSSSYLRDHGINDGLEQLIDLVESIDGVKSARILYLYPSTTTLELIEKISDSKLFHTYFDMPLQHITSNMLKIMKRGKGTIKVKELMAHMQKMPNSFIRSTFIVGHPGETLEDFEELCEYVKNYRFDRANVFSYSDEDETKAFEMDDKIDQEEIDRRAEILGDTNSEFGGSLYMKKLYGKVAGTHPEVDFTKELALWDLVIEANKEGLLQSAKDVNVGGVAIAAAKMAVVGQKGVNITMPLTDNKDIFAESLSRAIVEVSYEDEPAFETLVGKHNINCTKIGTTGTDMISINGIKKSLADATDIYYNTFKRVIEQDL